MKLSHAVAAFNAAYTGRDFALPQRLNWWVNELGPDVDVTTIDADQVDQAMVRLANRGAMRNISGRGLEPAGRLLSPSTLNRYQFALGSLFKYLRQRRILPRTWHNPLRDLPSQPESEGRLCYLTADQVKKVVAIARTLSWSKLPALILTTFNSGLRRGALMGLRWRDVDWEAGTVTVERTKNGRGIVSPLTPETMAELKAIKNIDDKPDSLIFCGKHPNKPHDFRHSWERALSEAGIPYMPFHAMRHSTASHAAKNGASTVMLMNILGHSSPKMSARYAHFAVSDKAEFVNRIF